MKEHIIYLRRTCVKREPSRRSDPTFFIGCPEQLYPAVLFPSRSRRYSLLIKCVDAGGNETRIVDITLTQQDGVVHVIATDLHLGSDVLEPLPVQHFGYVPHGVDTVHDGPRMCPTLTRGGVQHFIPVSGHQQISRSEVAVGVTSVTLFCDVPRGRFGHDDVLHPRVVVQGVHRSLQCGLRGVQQVDVSERDSGLVDQGLVGVYVVAYLGLGLGDHGKVYHVEVVPVSRVIVGDPPIRVVHHFGQ